MAGALGLSDVSEEDIDRKTGEKSKLKTGNLKRSYNMPKECVKRKMKTGMSRDAAVKACYPDQRFSPFRKQKVEAQRKEKRAIYEAGQKKYKKKKEY